MWPWKNKQVKPKVAASEAVGQPNHFRDTTKMIKDAGARKTLPDGFTDQLLEAWRAKTRREWMTFQVEGVTERTTDNKSRQVQLRKMKMQEPPYNADSLSLEISDEEKDGHTAHAIIINGFHFGWIPYKDEARFEALAEYFERAISADVKSRDGKYNLELTLRFCTPMKPTENEIRAAEAVILNQKCSVAFLQQNLNVSYLVAAKLIDALYDLGVIGDRTAEGDRKVLIQLPSAE